MSNERTRYIEQLIAETLKEGRYDPRQTVVANDYRFEGYDIPPPLESSTQAVDGDEPSVA